MVHQLLKNGGLIQIARILFSQKACIIQPEKFVFLGEHFKTGDCMRVVQFSGIRIILIRSSSNSESKTEPSAQRCCCIALLASMLVKFLPKNLSIKIVQFAKNKTVEEHFL